MDELIRQKALIKAIQDQDVDAEYELFKNIDPATINMDYKNALSDILTQGNITSSTLKNNPYIKSLGYDIKIQDPVDSVFGWHNSKTKTISAPDMAPDTLLHEIAHVEDTRNKFKSVPPSMPISNILPKTGLPAAQIVFSGHHQMSPMVSKELLHNILSGNKFYTSADLSNSSKIDQSLFSAEPVYKVSK